MPVNVVMPQMGESVAEGTLVRWIKKVGDPVERDEPLFEISTDKVDAEIPSPAAGTLAAIRVKEGETVPVDSVVAVIAQAGEDAAVEVPPEAVQPGEPPPSPRAQPDGSPAPAAAAAPQTAAGDTAREERPRAQMSKDEIRRQRSSPLVRRIASEHNVDISDIPGSGISGRVTKQDILKFIEQRGEQAPGTAVPGGPVDVPARIPAYTKGERVEIVPMSVMRRKIAEHMVLSRRTSAHVHSVFEVDFSRVWKIREEKKAEYERAGAKLTFLSFIARAVVDALRAFPILNSSIDGDKIVYKKDINLGIAVALDWGLIVPVLKNADEKNLLGLSRGIADLANRARAKQLKPEEVQGGTFTITNPGVFGTQFGFPIINQPQVAILCVGAVEKRAVVIDDAIAIRPRCYLTLGYDHRLIDGAVADQFMSRVKQGIERFDPAGA
ncbi:MAG TPA: dihydrolipoamide acetyltransferase family protein [Vicinamibacterales bacterium]